jgi:mannobiose 2-epimerase
LTHGVDWQYGGIYRDGLRDGGPVVLEKEFWQQAEALVGFLDGYAFMVRRGSWMPLNASGSSLKGAWSFRA